MLITVGNTIQYSGGQLCRMIVFILSHVHDHFNQSILCVSALLLQITDVGGIFMHTYLHFLAGGSRSECYIWSDKIQCFHVEGAGLCLLWDIMSHLSSRSCCLAANKVSSKRGGDKNKYADSSYQKLSKFCRARQNWMTVLRHGVHCTAALIFTVFCVRWLIICCI